jgi:hypothetical protein
MLNVISDYTIERSMRAEHEERRNNALGPELVQRQMYTSGKTPYTNVRQYSRTVKTRPEKNRDRLRTLDINLDSRLMTN